MLSGVIGGLKFNVNAQFAAAADPESLLPEDVKAALAIDGAHIVSYRRLRQDIADRRIREGADPQRTNAFVADVADDLFTIKLRDKSLAALETRKAGLKAILEGHPDIFSGIDDAITIDMTNVRSACARPEPV